MKMEPMQQLVVELCLPDRRERAMSLLCRQLRQQTCTAQELAPLLWHSFGSVAALLQEILSIYHDLSPPTLSTRASMRVCEALDLLQSVAAHPETRSFLLNACIHVYLYPFLSIRTKTQAIENLRVASLGVICAFVKDGETQSLLYFLETPIVPRCLFAMDFGSERSRIRATFILRKILMDDCGLRYICSSVERILAVGHALCGMVLSHSGNRGAQQLLKQIVFCYIRLLDHPRGLEILADVLPYVFRDPKFNLQFPDDPEAELWYRELIYRLSTIPIPVDKIYPNYSKIS